MGLLHARKKRRRKKERKLLRNSSCGKHWAILITPQNSHYVQNAYQRTTANYLKLKFYFQLRCNLLLIFKKLSYSSILFLWHRTHISPFTLVASECLFVGGGCRVGELCHHSGECGPISCPFNAQPFVIHGFSFTLNRITWLLCQDSGLGTLIWESP